MRLLVMRGFGPVAAGDEHVYGWQAVLEPPRRWRYAPDPVPRPDPLVFRPTRYPLVEDVGPWADGLLPRDSDSPARVVGCCPGR
jgi:hypothetical protein